MGRIYSTKEKLGTWVHDWPRLLVALSSRRGWMRMRNRADAIAWPDDRSGVACHWEYTRTLHVADVFPFTGGWLMRRALADWPIRLQPQPAHVNSQHGCSNAPFGPDGETPDVSFLIGHRGRTRWPLLQTTLQSIAAQSDVRFEVVVVEQDEKPLIRDELPPWVRYIHSPCPPDLPYCRSWAFNVAARAARAPLLILHDNDMLVPARYAAQSLRLFHQGWEVLNLKRFIFYLAESQDDVASILAGRTTARVESVVQNLEGGGSMAIGAEAFHEIGGLDEAFVGWGGEDNEFWDRCLTRRVWEYAGLPIIHLWHPPQPGKRIADGWGQATADLTRRRRALPPEQRIAELQSVQRGRIEKPPV